MKDTISAIATAIGVASISIIRVSGPKAKEIASKVAPKATLRPREAILTPFFDKNQEMIDQGIILYFKAPNSFTGEDIVEFHSHGGVAIAQEILESTLAAGARLAKAGEFSKRAFLNGKIDLTKAEAIAKIIEAKSSDALKILARQLKGELKEFVDKARDDLLQAIAYSEVMIDYAEEDIPSDILEKLEIKLLNLKRDLENILDSSLRRKGLIEGFKLAIIGKPNVGKSSLLNSLLNYERAIVSEIAGTTRDTIEESIRIKSHIVRVVDTAGIRDSKDQIEKIGIKRSLNSVKEADIIVALFDSSREFDEEDQKIVDLLEKNKDKIQIILLNKIDLKMKFDIKKIEKFSPIKISKDNIKPFLDKLEKVLESFSVEEELILSSNRQIEAVKETIKSINEAFEPLKKEELEFFSYHLQEAVSKISQITTPYQNEEILDKMFSEFCLGK
jgi:tRNA modification GTPase